MSFGDLTSFRNPGYDKKAGSRLLAITHLSDDEPVAKMGYPTWWDGQMWATRPDRHPAHFPDLVRDLWNYTSIWVWPFEVL
jgi:hypothetical protein